MSFKVQLHVYDLSGGMAKSHSKKLTQKQFDGVWNTGIIVYGKEFYFGGGICYDLPGHTPFGQPTKVLDLGVTETPEEIFMELLSAIRGDYTTQTFNILTNNCNDFTNAISSMILDKGIPREYNDQYKALLGSQLGKQMLPFLMNAQQSLNLISNPLFTEGDVKYPLKIKQHGEKDDPNTQSTADQSNDIEMNYNPNFQRQSSYVTPILGELVEIKNTPHLKKIISDFQGVVQFFWAPDSGSCNRFMPLFQNVARCNINKNVVFCSINCDRARDVAEEFIIRQIPTFIFFLNGKEHGKFVGFEENKFRQLIDDLNQQTMSKALSHYSMDFKQFKPMHLVPIGFTAPGQIDKMKEFISKLVISSSSTIKVNNFQTWLQTFDIKNISSEAVDQLVNLAQTAEDKSKIALIDLLRLIVLNENQADYVFGKHWNLIEKNVFDYISSLDLRDQNNKVAQNYHLVCLKFLTNVFQTTTGRKHMQNESKGQQIIQFCTRSMLSCNSKTVFHSAICLFNHLLCYEAESKKNLTQDLQQALKAIDSVLSEKDFSDNEALLAILLCECRILYQNIDVCNWVEETFKVFFRETHEELKKRCKDNNLKETIADVVSMVQLDGKK